MKEGLRMFILMIIAAVCFVALYSIVSLLSELALSYIGEYKVWQKLVFFLVIGVVAAGLFVFIWGSSDGDSSDKKDENLGAVLEQVKSAINPNTSSSLLGMVETTKDDDEELE